MEILIRKAKLADIPNIINLASKVSPVSIPPTRTVDMKLVETFRKNDLESLSGMVDLPHVGIFIAEDEKGTFLGHLLGFAGDIESVTGEKQGWIFDLAVDEIYRRKGVAQKLTQKFIDFIKDFGLNFVGLLVTSANKEAVGFYEKMGFIEERKRMAKKIN